MTFQLAAVGVIDPATLERIGLDHPRWPEYEAWLAAGNVPQPLPAVAPSREALLADQWSAIKERRRQCTNGGVAVDVAGEDRWFHTDADSRIQWLDLLADVRDGTLEPTLWKSMSGVFVPLTDDIVLAYRAALKAKERAAFVRAETLRAAVNAAADPREIDITAGWPASYDDPLPIPEAP